MRYQQTREVMQKLAPEYHRKVKDYFQQLADCDVSPRVRLMLDYLIDHEEQRALALAEYCQLASRHALDYWFKGVEIPFPQPPADLIPEAARNSLDELICAAVGYKQRLISYYSHLLERAGSKESRHLFQTLLTQEEKAMKRMIRHAQGLADL